MRPTTDRGKLLDSKTVPIVFVGYAEGKSFLIFISKTIVTLSGDAKFMERIISSWNIMELPRSDETENMGCEVDVDDVSSIDSSRGECIEPTYESNSMEGSSGQAQSTDNSNISNLLPSAPPARTAAQFDRARLRLFTKQNRGPPAHYHDTVSKVLHNRIATIVDEKIARDLSDAIRLSSEFYCFVATEK